MNLNIQSKGAIKMIDLSKLKADETPVKNVNIKIGGETQAFRKAPG